MGVGMRTTENKSLKRGEEFVSKLCSLSSPGIDAVTSRIRIRNGCLVFTAVKTAGT